LSRLGEGATTESRFSARELAYCGVLGAAALLLPLVFHLLRLGHVFMPMYLPLVTLPFFVGVRPAAVTALVVPLLSAVVTGMPPLYPPLAPVMALELAAMAAAIAGVRAWRRAVNEWLLLASVLVLGRVLNVALVWGVSLVLQLPAEFLAGVSFLAGWPGVVLMLLVVPPVVRGTRAQGGRQWLPEPGKGGGR